MLCDWSGWAGKIARGPIDGGRAAALARAPLLPPRARSLAVILAGQKCRQTVPGSVTEIKDSGGLGESERTDNAKGALS